MEYRVAGIEDIPQIQVVRHAVRENRLSDPSLVPDQDVEDYINRRGRGWVAVEEGKVVGFAIVSLLDQNVWALFILPEKEGMGIGRELHDRMMDWYFSQSDKPIWLSTAPGTRAAGFYRAAGWKENGWYGNGELKFEMNSPDWKNRTPVL